MHLYEMSVSNFVILVLNVDDIFLGYNNVKLLIEIKQLLSKYFEIKDIGNKDTNELNYL